ncbi:MAG: ankyrin repeat domain-containing protein, partial [Chitinophagaceae bacterium]
MQRMKFAVLGLFIAMSMTIHAQQKNVFLDPAFWQTKPGPEAIKAAIEKGNDPSEYNPSNFDPVVLAINNGAANESVKYLLEQKGNDVNKLTHDGRTYIFWAASKGNTELMEHLVSKGAKVAGQQDNHGYSVLNFAANGGQKDTKVYDICLKNGADLKKDLTHEGANALLLVLPSDADGKLTEYFVAKGLSLKSTDAQGNTAFDYAARAGNIGLMKSLKAKGISHTDNAIILAAQGSRRGSAPIETFQYLETIGIKPTVLSKNGENVLHLIVRRPGQEKLIQFFLDKGVKADQVNQDGNNVFMNAAAANRELSTLELLRSGITDINKANKDGYTALTLAVRSNSPEVVQYLVEKGAKTDVKDLKGDNLSVHLVDAYNPRQAKDFETKLDILKKGGLNITEVQPNGNTLYHLAVAKNDVNLLKLVSTLTADVNAANKEGFTALHKAAMLGKDDAVLKYL